MDKILKSFDRQNVNFDKKITNILKLENTEKNSTK